MKLKEKKNKKKVELRKKTLFIQTMIFLNFFFQVYLI
jgi:hypothetical protein